MRLAPSGIRYFATALTTACVVLVGACGDEPTEGGHPAPAQIRLLSPATQSGTPGWPLPDSVIVEVLDASGNALRGVAVRWTADNGADVVGRPADTTNITGRASAEWTLGRTEGQQTLSIAAGDLAPVTVVATATIFHAAFVTVGEAFACALTEAGGAFCWGSNDVGQLGNGKMGPSVLTPTPVQTALRFAQISAEGVGTYANSTCGLTAAGEAWCWGDNSYGRLGDGTTTSSAVPVRVSSNLTFTSIHTGYFHTCATAASGELWCWGEQDADTGAFGARPAGLYPTPVALHEDFRFANLELGWNYTCGLTAERVAFCWGANWFGGLGSGELGDPSAVPVPVAGGHAFTALSAAGYKETHGLTTDGVLYRWGRSGTEAPQFTPVVVTELRFAQVDSGEEPFDVWYGACGISAANSVNCVRDDGLVRGVPAPAAP